MYAIKKTRTVILNNPRTGEVWHCPDFTQRRTVDGVEFVEVHKPDNSRMVWINLNTVVRSKK